MPAIRDMAVNYTATTTALHFPIAAPATIAGDLLLCQSSADTGTQIYFVGEPVTYCYRDIAGTPTDYTAAANNDTAGDVQLLGTGTPAVNNAFYVGSTTPFNAVGFLISTAGAGTWTLAWEYFDTPTGAWVALPGMTDLTVTTGTAVMRSVRFTVPGDWATTTLQSQTLYWIRMRIATYSAVTTRPLATRVFVCKFPTLFAQVSTVSQGVNYKYATASEPDEYYVIYTTAETANGALIAIRDVDQKAPFSTTLPAAQTYNESNVDSDQAVGDATTTAVSQCFAATAGLLATCKFYLKKNGSPTGTAVAKLYAMTGALGTTGLPTGRCLALSDTFDVSTLTTSYDLTEFRFTYPYTLTATNWCIVLEYSAGNASNYVQVGYDASASGHAGNKGTYAAAAWAAQATQDCAFYCYNFTYTTGTATTSKSAMPTMTTSRDNSLVMWLTANATTLTVPSILEGPCTFMHAKDGTAHSDGASWGWQKTAGTTSAAVYQTNLGPTTGQTNVTAVVGISPPSTGATVIPSYCASDASVYIEPLVGAAYNGNSVPAATATSVFGTLLNGKGLSNAGATLTRTDVGLNTYHPGLNVLGLVTSNVWAGLRQTFLAGNKPSVAGKNLLFHIQPYLPLDLQTTDSVALAGTIGVAIGLSSVANTDYMVWHVGGSGTPWGASRYIPAVINTSYTGVGRIQNTGTLNAASIAELGFFVSGKVVASSWLFMSCWMLDTCAIAGGNAAEPVKIPGIVQAAAYGKERRSVIQEGASQFMIFGPIQIGNGGTNPVYLNLDGTALEFPQQYDLATANVNYCSVDNVCGIKYYAGASDTIIHKNSVVSSKSRYFWGLHASADVGAAYDFNGLSVIGAGTITLAVAVTSGITGLTINDYSTIDASGMDFIECTFRNPPAASASITVTSATLFTTCAISVTTVTAAGYWCTVTNYPTIFVGCTFTGSGASGHALRITTPGTYSLVGNAFNSFGANGTNFAAILNESGGLVTLNISGGGNIPTYRNVGGVATTVVNAAVSITYSGFAIGTEIRVYIASTGVEAAGIETTVASTWVASLQSGVSYNVVAIYQGYLPIRQEGRSYSSDQTSNLNQQVDRNYLNP